MMGTMENKLNEIRKEAIKYIVNFLIDNNLKYINFAELDLGYTPMVTPDKSLDCIDFEKGNLTFDASGEYDNDFYLLSDVSTDCLVEIVDLIESNKEEILNNEE